MAGNLVVEANPEPAVEGAGLVLVVSQDGTVCTVLEASSANQAALTSSTLEDFWPPTFAATIRGHVKRCIKSRRLHTVEAEIPNDQRTGEFIFIAQGPDRVLLIVRDVSERSLKLSRMQQLAYTDEVTGLPNREFLLAELEKITDMQRLKEGRAAMICINVSQFDDHGHALNAEQQDLVLKELAARLPSQLRRVNEPTVPDHDRYSIVARTDFRQFGIVLPSIEAGEDAEAVIERVLRRLKQPVAVGARSVTILAHGGVALFPQDGIDPPTLYRNAVAAMEDARNSHTEAFKLHSGTVRMRAIQRQDLELELRTALEREEYALNYLPIVDPFSRKPLSMEALLRWPDKVAGSQSTREIVSIAARTGLIVPIGAWVMRHACSQLRIWQVSGHTGLRVTVNLSTQEFSRADLVGRIETILAETGIEPCDLDLEIQESVLFRDAMKGYSTCKNLKALGVGIVIDDYGTGACSLAHLAHSPVDGIKIDNTFIANLETSEKDQRACTAAAALASKLGIQVIAEGVETEAQAVFLQEQGYDQLQGFLFAKPIPDAGVGAYLKESAQS